MLERLRQAMRVRQLTAGFAGLALGLLLDVISNWLGGPGIRFLPFVVLFFVATSLWSIWLWWRSPARITLQLKPVRTVRTEAEKREHARRGVVAFVALYRPGRSSPASKRTKEDWMQAARALDYAALDLPQSNLATTIEAIQTHASRLEYCWLISTICNDPRSPGSRDYVPVLVEYLRQEHRLQCEFHYQDFEVCLDDDALVFTRTLDVMRKIFDDAQARGLAAADLICDFTSGIRSMALGMILTCLDPDRDIEMIGTRYNAEGDPIDPRFPTIFGFQPILQQE